MDKIKNNDKIKFDDTGIYVAIGKSGYGKTFLLNWLVFIQHQKFDYIYIFSPNGINSFQYIPNELRFRFFHTYANDKFLKNLIKLQERRYNEGKPNRIALFFDDMYVNHDEKSKVLKFYSLIYFTDICQRFRQPTLNASIFISIQRYTALNSYVRGNISYLFLFAMKATKKYKELYDEFCTTDDFKKLHQFVSFVEQNTRNDQVIMVDFRNKELRSLEQYSFIKAKPIPKGWEFPFNIK
jgi:energy-coupling factor transporter ATP-binding protein EcfA2